jgi:hypothetical protein
LESTGFQWFHCCSWFWRNRNWITTSAYSYCLVEHKRQACQGLPGHNARCKSQVLACFSCVYTTSWFQYLFCLKLEEIRYEVFLLGSNLLKAYYSKYLSNSLCIIQHICLQSPVSTHLKEVKIVIYKLVKATWNFNIMQLEHYPCTPIVRLR